MAFVDGGKMERGPGYTTREVTTRRLHQTYITQVTSGRGLHRHIIYCSPRSPTPGINTQNISQNIN